MQRTLSPAMYKLLLFIHVCAALVAVIAGLDIVGWIMHSSFLVQIRPEYSAMKFNTALGLFFAALSLAALNQGHERTAVVFSGLGIILPILTLLEYALDINFGIDNFFIMPFLQSKVQFPGRMAPNTAIALALANFGPLFYALFKKALHRAEVVIALTGSLIFVFGIVPLADYMGGIESAHTWGQFTGIAIHTSVCSILLGVSLVVCALRMTTSPPAWLAAPIAIGFLMIAFSMWQAIRSYEDIRFEQSLQQEAEYFAVRGTDRLTAFYAALDRVAGRWVQAGGTPRPLWEADMAEYLKAYPFLKTIEWVGSDSYLRWAVPVETLEKLQGIKLNTEGPRAEMAQLAIATHMPQLTKSVDLLQGGKGFLYMNPLFIGDRFDGMIVSAFELDEVFNRILMRDKNGPFYLTVTEGSNVLFTNTPAGYTPIERWQKSVVMKSGTDEWKVTVNPTPELFARKNSALANLILATGLLTSIFAAFSVIFAVRSRQDSQTLRASAFLLRQIIDVNSLIGSAHFELQVFMDSVAERMRILTPATGAVIELIDKTEMVYQAVSGNLLPYKNMRLKLAGSLSGLCTTQNEVMISPDTMADPRVDAVACKKVSAYSMVVAPLNQRGTVVGVLKIVSTLPNAFHDRDIDTLKIMTGLLGGALGQELEIIQRRNLEDQLRILAQYDALTGLPNRTLFSDRLSQAIINNRRNAKQMAVMYMDIDHFKSINDKYGHAEGDALLQAFSMRVRAILRQGDTLARLGGDEFVLIAENLRNAADAENIASKIVNIMQKPFDLPTAAIKVGASIGVAISAGAEVDADKIVAQADEALYEVKKGGRNNFKSRLVEAA